MAQQNQAPDPRVVEEKIKKVRANLETAVKDVLGLVGDKTLEQNKSQAHKNTEKQTQDILFKAILAMENENVGEGMLALGATTLRTTLRMRDRINEVEYLLLTTIKELKTMIESKLGTKMDEIKKQ